MIPLAAATGVAGGGAGAVVVGAGGIVAGGVLGMVVVGAGGMVTAVVLVVVVGTRADSSERAWLTDATSESPADRGPVPTWSTATTRKIASTRATRHPKGSQPGLSASAPAA